MHHNLSHFSLAGAIVLSRCRGGGRRFRLKKGKFTACSLDWPNEKRTLNTCWCFDSYKVQGIIINKVRDLGDRSDYRTLHQLGVTAKLRGLICISFRKRGFPIKDRGLVK